jgi:aminoglycoside 6'-N-acetyltransferase I
MLESWLSAGYRSLHRQPERWANAFSNPFAPKPVRGGFRGSVQRSRTHQPDDAHGSWVGPPDERMPPAALGAVMRGPSDQPSLRRSERALPESAAAELQAISLAACEWAVEGRPERIALVKTPVDIRRVGPDAFDEAFYLLERFFREEGFGTPAEAMRSSLRTMLVNPNSAVFVARQEGNAVGVATVTTSVGIEYGRSAELDDLYVLPEARGRGIAGTMIEAVCSWCRGEGVTAVLVTVTQEGEANHQLLDYYRRRGFTNTGRLILERAL